jgi:FKBP-type peptidyl-prolyl cis-trans isomerase SlyD
MRVDKDRVVAIDYTIRDAEGSVVESTVGGKPFVYLHGYDQIVPGIESAIEGRGAGALLELDLSPDEAYGERDPGAILTLPRRAFSLSEAPEVGDLYRARRPDGRPVVFTVLDVSGDAVVIDANHPLAGKTLHVEVQVLSVRPATAEERQHEHVHPEATVSQELLA